ncbi:MAG: metal-dependent hydrolase [Burkholderiaceae bacterium]
MDIVAHGLWAGLGVAWLRRSRSINRRTAVATVALAMLPDLAQLLPLIGLALVDPRGFGLLKAYAGALPGYEPSLPPLVALATHHLHCILHSAVIAGAVTLLLWWRTRAFWLPLAGWWSHIVIDVFTHSADYYPVPVLYPITYRGFDGLAWNTLAFMIVNYAAIGIAAVLLAWRGRSRRLP